MFVYLIKCVLNVRRFPPPSSRIYHLRYSHIQYLSFCGSLTFIILSNRAPIVEKSIQIILMMKNTVNITVKYIMLQIKIAVFYATI